MHGRIYILTQSFHHPSHISSIPVKIDKSPKGGGEIKPQRIDIWSQVGFEHFEGLFVLTQGRKDAKTLSQNFIELYAPASLR